MRNGRLSNSTDGLGTSIAIMNQFVVPDLYLEFCVLTDPRYQAIRERHYVRNKGVHAQQVHFLVNFKGEDVGIISGSSCVYATPARDKFFGITSENREKVLRGIINNVVFRINPEKSEKNLATRTLALWRKVAPKIWEDIYQVSVYGFETLVIEKREHITEGGEGSVPFKDDPEKEKWRLSVFGDFKNSPGTLYKADNWTFVGPTEGNTKEHDDVGLNKAFKRTKVDPKNVWCKWRDGFSKPVESETIPTWQANQKWRNKNGEENQDFTSRIVRSFPGMTEEKWAVFSTELKVKAKEMSKRREAYFGKRFFSTGRTLHAF